MKHKTECLGEITFTGWYLFKHKTEVAQFLFKKKKKEEKCC